MKVISYSAAIMALFSGGVALAADVSLFARPLAPNSAPGPKSAGMCRIADIGAPSPAASYLFQTALATTSVRAALADDPARPRARMLDAAQSAVTRGEAESVVDALEQAANAAKASGDQRALAETLGVLGLAYGALGRNEAAKKAFEESVAAASQSGALDVEAKSQFNSANLALTQSELSLDGSGAAGEGGRGAAFVAGVSSAAVTEAGGSDQSKKIADSYTAAAIAAERAGEPLLAARARLNAGRLLLLGGKHSDALRSLSEAASALRGGAASPERALVGVGVGDAFLSLGEQAPELAKDTRKASATALLAAIADSGAAKDVRMESFGRGVLGRVYAANGDAPGAMAATREALQLAQGETARDIAFQWRGQLGDLYRRTGDKERALALYAAALKDVDAVRGSLAAVDPISGRSVYRSAVEPIYLAYADLLIERAQGENAASFLLQARDVVDQLKAVEIEQYFQDDCVSGLLDTRLKDEDLPDRVAILYPIMLADRLEIIVQSGGVQSSGRIVRATSQVKPREIAEAAAQLRAALRADPTAKADFETPSRALYRWLIAPVADFLREAQIETILFAPDAALRGVPLNVLQSADGKFLIEEFATATAISAALIGEPAPRTGADRRALYASLGEERVVEGLEFAALSNVGPEIDAARKIFPGPAPLVDDDFTEARLGAALAARRYDIVHFATHATFGGRSENSYLLAYGDEAADDASADGRLTINEFEQMIAEARIRGGGDIELITLSACETAAGNDQSILGLAGVAYKSGARSVFASLWAINDASTAAFVPDFYKAMRGGASKAKALQSAQTGFLNDPARAAYRHPYYWSPFILLGEWE